MVNKYEKTQAMGNTDCYRTDKLGGLIFWKNLDYQYTFQGLETTIGEDSYVGVSNYEVEDNAYRVTGEDPRYI